jgi:hypothetical protein
MGVDADHDGRADRGHQQQDVQRLLGLAQADRAAGQDLLQLAERGVTTDPTVGQCTAQPVASATTSSR